MPTSRSFKGACVSFRPLIQALKYPKSRQPKRLFRGLFITRTETLASSWFYAVCCALFAPCPFVANNLPQASGDLFLPHAAGYFPRFDSALSLSAFCCFFSGKLRDFVLAGNKIECCDSHAFRFFEEIKQKAPFSLFLSRRAH